MNIGKSLLTKIVKAAYFVNGITVKLVTFIFVGIIVRKESKRRLSKPKIRRRLK